MKNGKERILTITRKYWKKAKSDDDEDDQNDEDDEDECPLDDWVRSLTFLALVHFKPRTTPAADGAGLIC